jgi:hypothetical protein
MRRPTVSYNEDDVTISVGIDKTQDEENTYIPSLFITVNGNVFPAVTLEEWVKVVNLANYLLDDES